MGLKQIIATITIQAVQARLMSGKVYGLEVEPIPYIKITVNDVYAATTDNEGAYVIEVADTSIIGVDNEFNFFNKVKVSPSSDGDDIPDLIAKSVGLCGTLNMFDDNLQLRLVTPANDHF